MQVRELSQDAIEERRVRSREKVAVAEEYAQYPHFWIDYAESQGPDAKGRAGALRSFYDRQLAVMRKTHASGHRWDATVLRWLCVAPASLYEWLFVSLVSFYELSTSFAWAHALGPVGPHTHRRRAACCAECKSRVIKRGHARCGAESCLCPDAPWWPFSRLDYKLWLANRPCRFGEFRRWPASLGDWLCLLLVVVAYAIALRLLSVPVASVITALWPE